MVGVEPNNSTAQTLPFTQDWTNTGLITADDNWSGVPGIEGFFIRNDSSTTTAVDPQTLTGDTFAGGGAPELDVIANQTSTGITNGGVAEFHTTSQSGTPGTNPTIALQGSGTADAPFILLNLNTTGQTNINVAYNLRDIDCTADNAVQPVALMFRVGNTGSYTNVASGFVADATTGPSLCTAVTAVSATLPVAANNQSLVQVRIITANAAGNDEWVGIDDINVTAGAGPSQPTLSINDVTKAEGNSGTTNFDFTVSLTSAAGAGGVSFTVNTANGTTNPATAGTDYVAIVNGAGSIAQGSTSTTVTVQVNGDTTTEPDETFFVNISNVTGATAGDVQGLGTITNDDVTLTPIHTIQGSGTTSPLATQVVTTRGIVTGIKAGSSGGFFLQEPDATIDADPNTSEGIFVFTGSSVPSAAVVGNLVQVTGTVVEFVFASDPNSPPITELSGSPTVSVLSTGNALPTPHTITAAETTAPSGTTNPLDSLEEFEGMRVTVPSLTVVAPTQGTINEPNATVTSNGVFYGVVTGVARPFREPGISISDPLPAGSPGSVPRFDENPERIRVDSDGQPGTTLIDVAAGTVLSNVTGPLDYSFRTYTILPDTTITPGTQPGAVPAPTPTASELTIASFNMERFFDDVNDPAIGEPVLTTTAYNKRLDKASRIIRTVQKYPDVIGVEEVENLSTLQAVAAKINADAQSIDSLPNPNYVAYLSEGNDVGGIDNGFLVKESRVTTVSVQQFNKNETYTNPNNNTQDILNDRPPLVLRATAPRPGGGTFAFTVIVNHLRSLSGIDDETADGTGTAGGRVRAKRQAQAVSLANLIQSFQSADPNEKIITVGDMNAFQFNDGYADLIGTIKGTPSPDNTTVVPGDGADLVNPDLTDLVDTLSSDQRYSFSFDGNAQVLDHIIINQPTLSLVNRFVYARDDADYPVKNYELANELRLSDHDQPIVYLSLGVPQPAGSLIISEFRFRGPGAAFTRPAAVSKLSPLVSSSRDANIVASTPESQDEFVELYNNTDSNITVSTTDGSAGWTVVSSDGNELFRIDNGTVIPARGHYLGTNGNGYSLSGYANGDVAWVGTDIPDNGGVALFRTNNPANYTLSERLDAAGYATVAALYREGAGFPTGGSETTNNLEYSFVRSMARDTGGLPKDTGNNVADFISVDTNGTATGQGQNLGAPGPENLFSPIQRNAQFGTALLDPSVSSSASPNRSRDFTGDPANNSNFGTMTIRRTFTNNTGAPVTRLRFRIIEVTTFPTPNGTTADLRARSSNDTVISVGGSPVNVRGTTVETPPVQPKGGGWNTSMNVGFINFGSPLANGASVSVQFLLGVQQTGTFKFFINIEAGDAQPAPASPQRQ